MSYAVSLSGAAAGWDMGGARWTDVSGGWGDQWRYGPVVYRTADGWTWAAYYYDAPSVGGQGSWISGAPDANGNRTSSPARWTK